MKKLLLTLWNFLFDLKKKTVDFFLSFKDKIYTSFNSAPKVMTSEETVEYILKNNCSVARFGDGEIKLASGKNILFQETDDYIEKRLTEVLHSDKKDVLVCLPAVFDEKQLSILVESHVRYWKNHLAKYRKKWYKPLIPGKVYGNAFISRHYMNLKEKDRAGCEKYFELVKKIWEDKDIIIVEGEKSRLGMGNDLFNNAKSVRRILGPSAQCFRKYDRLLKKVKTFDKDALYILALGPAATVMAYDLAEAGFTAIDMGNIDTEYEWFLAGATEKQPVKNKLVYEAMRGTVGEAEDPKYLSQIVAKVL